MLTTLWAVVIFLLVILFHEFGHFVVAKLLNVRVNEFSIGMGPTLLKRQAGETKYSLRMLPIGGFVSMEGEDSASDDPRSFSKSAVWKRFLIIVAGALMNFVLALLVLLLVFGLRGKEVPVIGAFTETSALEQAGFQIGDRITAIGDVEISSWQGLLERVETLTPETPVEVHAQRDGSEFVQSVKPLYDESSGRTLLGLVPATQKDPGYTVQNTLATFGVMITAMVDFFASLLRGAVGLDDVSGPVGIIGAIGQASAGGLFPVLMLLAFISVNVGFVNLLPIPALDGGKIFFLLIEAIRGKPLPAEKESIVHFIGFALLMLLILIVTFKDVLRLGLFGG